MAADKLTTDVFNVKVVF